MNETLKYLFDYKDGKIKQGLGLDIELDTYLRFKPKQLNIILGHDNVGKTYWINWYFLALTTKHGLKWCIWSGENQSGQIMRDLIQMYTGIAYKNLTKYEIENTYHFLEPFFQFVPNNRLYTPEELLDIFGKSDCNACLIDPFTGLDRQMGYEANYKFLNMARQFCNTTGKTIYINTHPTSESGRSGMLYGDDQKEWKGHLKPPLKDHVEGGKSFLNRCDDMIVVHRLVKHESMRYETMISVEKVKDTDTGGKQTMLNIPVLFNFNAGLGFRCGGIDPIKRQTTKKNNDLPF
jgi:hypothetical protein